MALQRKQMLQSETSSTLGETDGQQTHEPVRRHYAPRGGHKNLIKLSVNLLSTFNGINEHYYAEKAKRQAKERRRRHEDEKESPGEVLQQRYTLDKQIGSGSFGLVARGYDSIKQEQVAIKIVKSTSAFREQAQIELEVLRQLQQEPDKWNIVELRDTFMHHGHQCIVFELLDQNLFELLRSTKYQGERAPRPCVDLQLLAKWGKAILVTLSHLAARSKDKRPVIHCDLKPENILLRNGRTSAIKVIDFGSACFDDEKMYSYIQSRFYRAPEVLLGLPYSTAIDVWSLGCILVEMHCGRPLFNGDNERSQILKQIEILGLPPQWMMEKGKHSHKYFEKDRSGRWALKSIFRLESRTLQSAMGKYQDTHEYRHRTSRARQRGR